jgi:hypothetical protein
MFLFFVHWVCVKEEIRSAFALCGGDWHGQYVKASTILSGTHHFVRFQNILSNSDGLTNWWTVAHWGDFLWTFSDDEVGQNSLTSSAGTPLLIRSWLVGSVSFHFGASLSSAWNKRNIPTGFFHLSNSSHMLYVHTFYSSRELVTPFINSVPTVSLLAVVQLPWVRILIVVSPCMLTIIQLLFQLNAHVFYY